jgi:glycosyltransferase involved in cell wall biosynthesis
LTKVLICVPCLLVGGTEVHTQILARALVEAGYTVVVCAYYEYDAGMVEAVRRVGAEVRLLGLTRDGSKKNLGRMPRLAVALAKTIRDTRPDVVHVQYMTPGVAPVVVARLCRVPSVFATVHVPGHTYGKRIWVPRTISRLCDAFLCVSEVAERSFFGNSAVFKPELAASGRRHFTIHNAVDIEAARALSRSSAIDEKRKELRLDGVPVIGCVGRIAREKGQRWLLEAMPEVVRSVPKAKLLLVGDGALRTELVTFAHSQGIQDSVVWTGNVPREDVLCYFGVADVVVVPSMWEGFGLSAAEAMAMGKPVVASKIDGLEEVVVDGSTGTLVPYGDVPGLSAAIIEMLRDESKRRSMGIRAEERVAQYFSYETFARKIRELYTFYSSASNTDTEAAD